MIRFYLADSGRPQPKSGEAITIRGHFVMKEEGGKKMGVLEDAVIE